jgi:hypothetical protein
MGKPILPKPIKPRDIVFFDGLVITFLFNKDNRSDSIFLSAEPTNIHEDSGSSLPSNVKPETRLVAGANWLKPHH